VTDAATAAAPPFAHGGAGVDGEVFVSYSRRDGDFVGRLRRALEAAGKSVWVDTEDIPAATRWSDRIRQALEGAAAVVFVITPDSIVSAECDKELDAALAANKRIVPVRLRPVDPAATRSEIRELQWLHVPDGAVSESLVEATRITSGSTTTAGSTGGRASGRTRAATGRSCCAAAISRTRRTGSRRAPAMQRARPTSTASTSARVGARPRGGSG
jgi:hypothetical protein